MWPITSGRLLFTQCRRASRFTHPQLGLASVRRRAPFLAAVTIAMQPIAVTAPEELAPIADSSGTAAAAAQATASIPEIPNSTVRSSSAPGSERAAAARHADDAVVDREHAGDCMRDLLGPITQAPAASRPTKRHFTVGNR